MAVGQKQAKVFRERIASRCCMVGQTAAVPVNVSYAQVHGLRMAYRCCGAGDQVVFLHGNPTSSYLWRAVLGRVEHLGRCLAPDLVGMGLSQSRPAPGVASYRFVEHRDFLEALLEQLGVFERVVLVGHD